jgi:hypothetical protein
MKHLKPMLAIAVVLFAMAMPSISSAQYNEQRLDNFLNQRPQLKRQLERNPDLIYNKNFREKHPDLQQFMQNHPNVWGKMAGSNRWGAYGPDRNWHESDWWHQNNPGWMYQNHPEWARNHPDWSDDGDFDDNHQWHDRSWWNDHHPDWVQKHHPNWYKHEEHQAAKQQKFEEKHGYKADEGNQGDRHDHGDHGHPGNKAYHDHN